jgi:hypothetical protein
VSPAYQPDAAPLARLTTTWTEPPIRGSTPRPMVLSPSAASIASSSSGGVEAITLAGGPERKPQRPADRQGVGERDQPARGQHAPYLAQSGLLVCPVVEGHRRNDEIEARVAKRQGLGGALHEAGTDVGRQGRLGLTDHLGGRVDADQVGVRERGGGTA